MKYTTEEADESFEKWLEQQNKRPTPICTTKEVFRAGYFAALIDRSKCPDCGKDNNIHPSMRWCHQHRQGIN